ncbi:MAG: hypothetical protein M0R74_16570, partial [Dehalococcoidia bacterium]|nr:hypothetical protein [Dehalococcoidia bacterium]
MTTVPGNEARIRFEGVSSSAYNIWGGTQANFLVSLPGYNAREVALFLNDPSGEFLAERLGVPDTPEFRARAAEAAGMIWIGRLLAGEGHFAPT